MTSLRLTEIIIPDSLDTSFDDLVTQFFIPILSRSVRYDRAVGFFTSGWLKYAALGMVKFAENGGKARWITSPKLADQDWEALRRGAEARDNELLKQRLLAEIDDLYYSLERHTLSALAWMVADGILEFKLAVMENSADFHAKFGIFTDEDGNQVSFTGSYNDSVQGNFNYESISLFSSWLEEKRVQSHVARFERLWKNEDPKVTTFDLPEAVRANILQLRDYERPYTKPNWAISDNIDTALIKLWSHQISGIDAWENNSRVGLMNMATGTGKTVAAISAALRCPNLSMLIIAVPRKNLVDQWAVEIQKNTSLPEAILIYESSADWQDKLFNRIRSSFATNWREPVVLIGTMASLSSTRFTSVLTDAGIPERTLLIVDEVHNVGASSYQTIMNPNFPWRLGLSATPTRQFDEEGSLAIAQYFDRTVFTYDLRQALADGRLSSYVYKVYPAELTEDEFVEYVALTQRILGLRGQASSDETTRTDNILDGDTEQIKRLLFERARILKKTESKIKTLERIIGERKPRRCLIYCADNNQLDQVREVLDRNQLPNLAYTAETRSDQRKSALDALEKGFIPILAAIDCLDEGVDVPIVNEAIILASSANKRQFIQRRGRILRRAPGKTKAFLTDIIVVPPVSVGNQGKGLLMGELARAKEMAQLADNHYQVLNQITELVKPYGVLLTELLSGESDD